MKIKLNIILNIIKYNKYFKKKNFKKILRRHIWNLPMAWAFRDIKLQREYSTHYPQLWNCIICKNVLTMKSITYIIVENSYLQNVFSSFYPDHFLKYNIYRSFMRLLKFFLSFYRFFKFFFTSFHFILLSLLFY